MKYAFLSDGTRSLAKKGVRAVCPLCRQDMRAKVGRINAAHWAHLVGQDCDPWSEPESSWHFGWKDLFPPLSTEVQIGPHRADIVGREGIVIELQNSALSVDSIEEREAFYRRMIWVLNAEKMQERFFIYKYREKNEFTFKWKNLKRSWLHAKRPIFLDFGCSRLQELLGAKRYSDSYYDYTEGSEYESKELLVRYKTVSSFIPGLSLELDPSLDPLPEFLADSSIVQILKLYKTGYGVGRGITLDSFLSHYRG